MVCEGLYLSPAGLTSWSGHWAKAVAVELALEQSESIADEEEVLPAIKQCLARVDELDQRLLAEQAMLQRCQLEADRDALAALRLRMV